MEDTENNFNKKLKSIVIFWLQIIFYIATVTGLIYNSCLTRKQNKLIFKPVVGVVEAKTNRLRQSIDSADTYNNVQFLVVDLVLQNKGNLPAKNFIAKTTAKVGNTTLPYTEKDNKYQGAILVQGASSTSSITVEKAYLDRVVINKEKLIIDVDISYTDWEEYNDYNYNVKFQVKPTSIDPFTVSIMYY